VSPDHVRNWRDDIPYDRTAIVMIGLIAMLAAVLAVAHTGRSMEASRASLEASRLAADITGRIGTASIAGNLDYASDEAVLQLLADGTDRSNAAALLGDQASWNVGQAEIDASTELKAALDETKATTGGAPADPYAAGLVRTTDAQFRAELAEQSHQMDIAENAGFHDRLAFLGLSLLALAGVLMALAVTLRQSRAGWVTLGTSGVLLVTAAVLAALAMM
jgi:hypothetical protein